MSSVVLKRKLGETSSQAAGFAPPRARIQLDPEDSASDNEASWYEVHIRWKPILHSFSVALEGTEPTYRREDTLENEFQLCVRFKFPLDKAGFDCEEVSAVGIKCSTLCEAESAAAAAAFQHFAYGIYNKNLGDISRRYLEDAKRSCEGVVREAGNLRLTVGVLMSGFFDSVHDIRDCYDGLSHRIENGADVVSKQIRVHVANRLHKIISRSDKLYNELAEKKKTVEVDWWTVRTEMQNHFHQFYVERVERFSRYFPGQTEISMSIVLSEMMISLGWSIPDFTVTSRVHNHVYVCEVMVESKEDSPTGDVGRITVHGEEEITEDEAIESGAEAAILYLEKELSIFLVDINYNKRSHTKQLTARTNHVLESFSALLSEGKVAWESKVQSLRRCDDNVQDMVTQHGIKDPDNVLYNVKWECADMIAKLYETCECNLRRGRRLHIVEGSLKLKRPKWTTNKP